MTENLCLLHPVATESSILEIPVFQIHESFAGSSSESSISPDPKKRRTSVKTLSSISTQDSIGHSCNCPHVLVSDDDPFQRFYYQTIFQKSQSDDSISDKESFRYEIFSSGEELVERFKALRECGCDRTTVVITDYDMGRNHYTGVQTISALKEAGYKGGAVLRTSEEKEDLTRRDSEFTELMISGTLCCFVEKSNFEKMKYVIGKIMSRVKTLREEGHY